MCSSDLASLVAAGGCVLISDRELTADRLRDEVLRIIKAPDALSRMSAAGRGLVPADAAQRVAAIVLEAARR